MFASCLDLSPAFFVAVNSQSVHRSKKSQKSLKSFSWEGGLRSVKVIEIDTTKSSSPVLVMISSMSVPI